MAKRVRTGLLPRSKRLKGTEHLFPKKDTPKRFATRADWTVGKLAEKKGKRKK